MINIIFEASSDSFDDDNGIASGWSDVRLSPKGMDQSKQIAERYAGQSIDAIFYSDLKRAEQTASMAFDLNPHLLFADWRLRDIDLGAQTGAPRDELEPTLAQHLNEPFQNGESFEQVVKRTYTLLTDIKDRLDGKTVMLIGHRANLYALQYLLNNVPLVQSVALPWEWKPGWRFTLQ